MHSKVDFKKSRARERRRRRGGGELQPSAAEAARGEKSSAEVGKSVRR